MNALNDALSQIGPGIQLNMVPATPDKVFAAIREAGKSA